MNFMNTYEIDERVDRFTSHPVLGPATRTLANLRDAANANSDGWCYWPKPARAAKKLMELIQRATETSWPPRQGVTTKELLAAYRSLKSFRTKSGIAFEIVEPEGA